MIKGKKEDPIVFTFQPKEFPIVAAKPAQDFVSEQTGVSADFQINDLISKQTGINELRRKKIEGQAEKIALVELKKIEEQAYQEAFQLGLKEGTEKAFEENLVVLNERMGRLEEIMSSMSQLKVGLVAQHEAQIVKLALHIASKVAMVEVQSDPALILEVLKSVVHEVESEERVVLKLASQDLEMIEELRKKSDKDWEFLERVEIESDPDLNNGGCLIETNYGSIDAQLESRIQKAWDLLTSKTPRETDQLSQEDEDLIGEISQESESQSSSSDQDGSDDESES